MQAVVPGGDGGLSSPRPARLILPMPLVLALAAAAATCPIEQARYALRTQPAVTAVFRDVNSGNDWPSQLALGVRGGGLRRTWWFVPWEGGTDGASHLASTTDVEAPGWRPPDPDGGPRPHGDFVFIATDARYDLLHDGVRAGGPAPAHMFIYNLSDVVWHTEYTPFAMEFFDRIACDRR